jgi:thioredoxin reductase
MTENGPHVAILGAGPTGLDAALAAVEAGYRFTLYEAAASVAGHVRGWSHVRLFTPWPMNLSQRMRQALTRAGTEVPDGDACPTGAELLARLLEPLAGLPEVAAGLRCGVEVRGVSRHGLLKHEEIGSAERASQPFRLLLGNAEREWMEAADIVLDCTGASVPRALGDGGIPAPGEASVDRLVERQIPDLGRDPDDWAGKRILLVGAGASGQTAVAGLVGLAARHPGTRIVWLLRGAAPRPILNDPLRERAALNERAAALDADPPECLRVVTGSVIERFTAEGDAVSVVLAQKNGERETLTFDRILALTGRVGDHLLYRELQVHECYATSGPMKLAATLLGQDGAAGGGGAGGDCLAQTSQGIESLKNPEPGFFILGLKSYGRRNDFLLRVGYQQVDEVFELLTASGS